MSFLLQEDLKNDKDVVVKALATDPDENPVRDLYPHPWIPRGSSNIE
jgi:hypothetical protein